MSPLPCPKRNQLLAYQSGDLTETAAEQLTGHLAECPSCQETLANLDKGDTLNQRLRQPAQPDPYADEAQARELQARSKAMVEQGRGGQAPGPRQPIQFGEYQVQEKLGQGGMGAVYKALHRSLRRQVAIKVLPKGRTASPEAIARFRREMAVVGQLIHPNIVTAYDAGEQAGIHYLVMEYVEGQDLARVVKQRGPLPVGLALECILQVARGLAHAHEKGIVHRDIKPGNLLLARDGTVKVLDLGLARLGGPLGLGEDLEGERLTQSGQVMGTCDYMAPEQALDTHLADHRSDIYSLGCTFYRLLVGRPPYKGETLMQVLLAHREAEIPSLCSARPDVSPQVDAVFQKMVAKRPEDRYQSMPELAADVEALLGLGGPTGRGTDSGDAVLAENLSFLVEEGSVKGTAEIAKPKPKTPWPPRTKWIAIGATAAALILFGIIITLRDRHGKVIAKVEAPPGSQVVISDRGDIDVTLPTPSAPGSAGGPTSAPGAPPPAIAPSSPQSPSTPGSEPGPLSGLVPRPAAIAGLGRWQIETVLPRLPVMSVAWSPDDRLVACTSGRATIRFYDAATLRLVRLLLTDGGHGRLAFSPDGKYLASAGQGKQPSVLRLWDVASGRPLGVWGGHEARIFSLAWSPDARRIATSCEKGDDAIRIWSVEGRLQRQWKAESAGNTSVAWSPDGARLVSCGGRDQIRIWTPEGKLESEVKCPAPVDNAAFSPDGRWLATSARQGDSERLLHLWDTKTWKSTLLDTSHGAPTLSWSPDSQRIAGCASAVAIVCCKLDGTPTRWTTGPSLYHLAWNRRGDSIAFALINVDATLGFLDPQSGQVTHTLANRSGQVTLMLRSPDGQRLATCSRDENLARLWTTQGKPGPTLQGHTAGLRAVAWSPDSARLATGGDDNTIRLWQAADGKATRSLDAKAAVRSLAWSPDGAWLISGGEDKKVSLWNVASGQAAQAEGHLAPVDELAWAPGGKQFASLSRSPSDNIVRLWHADGRPGPTLQGHQGALGGMAFSPDGTQLVTWCPTEVAARIWNAGDGSPGPKLAGHAGGVRVAAWSPEGNRLAILESPSLGGAQRPLQNIRLWRRDGTEEAVLGNDLVFHSNRLAWSPDGSLLAAWAEGADAMIRVWDVVAKQRVRDYRRMFSGGGPAGGVWVCWSNDSQQIFSSAALEGAIHGWSVQDGQTQWVAVPLADGQAVWIGAEGELETTGPEADKQLVYVAEQPDGAQNLRTVAEFRELLKKAPPAPSPFIASDGNWKLPPGAPTPAIAPFDAAKAREHQEAWAKYLGVPVEMTNSIGMKFVLIPPGEFDMGSTKEAIDRLTEADALKEMPKERFAGFYNEVPRHRLRITRAFYTGAHEVTVGQFRRFVESATYRTDCERTGRGGTGYRPGGGFEHGPQHNWRNVGYDQRDDHPVVIVSYGDCVEFCKWLSSKEGNGYRLPTEAEWEYAGGAGTRGAYCFGDDHTRLPDYGWLSCNSNGMPHGVGEKQPNAWSLYDIHGNVFEWVSDYYSADYYKESPANDPQGPSTGSEHILRGGACISATVLSRITARWNYSTHGMATFGFRVVCEIPAKTESGKPKPDTPPQPSVPSARPATRGAQPSTPIASPFIAPDGKWRLPPGAPATAIAPFDAQKAREHQENWSKYLGVPVEMTNSIGMKLVLIPPGEFDMGSTPEEIAWVSGQLRKHKFSQLALNALQEEGPVHRIKLSRALGFGVYEVTQAEYEQVMRANPGSFSAKGKNAGYVAGKDTRRHPVEMVSWEEAAEFCRRLSAMPQEGPRREYRLPTEAEWEYSCRAGSTGWWSFGPQTGPLGDEKGEKLLMSQHAWSFSNSEGATHPVGEKKPNAWGLHDMHGNVWELCSNWFSAWYRQSPLIDPQGPPVGGLRVMRGGSWFDRHFDSRSGRRSCCGPADHNHNVGFRVVCEIPSDPAERRKQPAAESGAAVGSPGSAKKR